MEILKKFKSTELDGFRECVQSFETTPSHLLKSKLENATLEDPVYMHWVLKNMINIKHFLQLTSDDMEIVANEIKNQGETLVRAFYKTPLADNLSNELPTRLYGLYKSELENITELRKSTQENAIFSIIKTMRKLQESGDIECPIPWRLPSIEIVRAPKAPPANGEFILKYEDGIVALQGQIYKKNRIGIWKHFYPNGQLMAEGEYTQGNRTGVWKFWFSDGKQKSEGSFKWGVKQGQWVEWNRDGHQSVSEYENGKIAA